MIQGKKAIEDFWRTVMASGVKEVTLNTIEVSANGDFAVERGTGILKISPQNGAPSKQNIKYVVVWKRVANGWKNMWDIWNASP
jgi:ketosteroid isomerase-like protein